MSVTPVSTKFVQYNGNMSPITSLYPLGMTKVQWIDFELTFVLCMFYLFLYTHAEMLIKNEAKLSASLALRQSTECFIICIPQARELFMESSSASKLST